MLCQTFQLWRFRLVCLWQSIILFPPAKWDSNNSVQFNAFVSEAATNAVIVGTSVMIESVLMTVLSERNFPIFANWLTLSIFFSGVGGGGAGGASAPPKILICWNFGKNLLKFGQILENLGKIPENPNKIPIFLEKIPDNLGKNGARRCFTSKNSPPTFAGKQVKTIF